MINSLKIMVKSWVKVLPFCLFSLLPLFVSCSEETAEDEEFANWEARNDVYLASLVNDSLKQEGWTRIKKYSLNNKIEGEAYDYVYIHVMDSNLIDKSRVDSKKWKVCPAFTDSVRVAYQGRLIPSASYPQGKIFDPGTVYGKFSLETSSTTRFKIANMVDGFSTALQAMHIGDYWRVYIPSDLGYGSAGSGSNVPGNSLLIFDLILIDYSPVGTAMKPWY